MIPKFNDYFLLKESVNLTDYKGNSRNLTFMEMKNKFVATGYDYLGTIFIEGKSINAYTCKEFEEGVPEDIFQIVQKCGVSYHYVSKTPDRSYLSVSISEGNGKVLGDRNKLIKILGEPNIDKISSCYTSKGDLYFVFWNAEKKYFYFLRISDKGYISSDHVKGFVELWVKVRTSGVDVIRDEVNEINSKYLEKKRIEQEKEEERKRMETLKKEQEEAYQKRVDVLQADVEANPDNYEEVSYMELPDDVKADINSDDKSNVKYVEYIEIVSPRNPYDKEPCICYVNDDDFTKGYKYESEINCARPGTYWGD